MNVFEWGFVAAVLLAATPILYSSLAGALSSQVGVFNIALEGQMLWGAFAAVAGSFYTGSAWAGVLIAVVTTALFSVTLAVGSARWGADPIVIAIGTNLFALGITGFLMRVLFDVSGTFSPRGLQGLDKMSFLAEIPVLGPVFAGQTALVPLAFVFIVVIGLWLKLTPSGLRLRGVGEHPEAASSLGIKVASYQMWVTIAGGALCGIAGAQLSLGNVTVFTENMTAGRGWIAVAAVMLVMGRPLWLPVACLGFGAAEALGFRLQGIGAPQQLTDAAPYAITIAVLVGMRMWVTARNRRPSLSAQPVPLPSQPESTS
ncbi:nucleoside ABC transporter membrane protein [Glaciihabitans tibetensis]|uniref:Nucleoside ABC transporter membrane protein n=1 Tax=Glaciihabitans tibetensis TaxID=1266600 RepID=A0A2T0VJB1_9MICO|nr:ABC transporter permease [Glaciihabitans tibetensis]PRY70297.1 nucleoside ABC transporter membrane protein [Glaciihabitans tibetensis]